MLLKIDKKTSVEDAGIAYQVHMLQKKKKKKKKKKKTRATGRCHFLMYKNQWSMK